MSKVLWVAWREFSATVFTKGFLIGIVMTPLLILVVGGAVAMMKNLKGPQITGTVAIIDRSGIVGPLVAERFTERAVEQESEEKSREIREQAEAINRKAGLPAEGLPRGAGGMGNSVASAMAEQAREGPRLTLEMLPATEDPESAKQPLTSAKIQREGSGEASRLALVVIDPENVTGDSKGSYPSFKSYFADRLDFEIQERVTRRVGEAILDARLATDPRLKQSGLSPAEIRRLMGRPSAEAVTVTKAGSKKSAGEVAMLLPMGFMILLMVSVFTSGQYLLTSTVEEKSNRVMEMLLSAVSPIQLMTGKIVGGMLIGMLILALYSGIGIVGLVLAAKQDLVRTDQLVYLFIFFVIAYFLVASMMASIGAAVNDMREAQTLMSPVMVLLMLPWMTWFLIQRAPNSPLATILSFIPGPNPFVMMIRVCGSEPVPTWQIPVSILVGVLSVVGAAWGAGKVFRIGALMYGKPPNFKTLWKWIKMA